MAEQSEQVTDLLARAETDAEALGELLALHRDRLRRMVRMRLDRRLEGRVDASDIIQEVHLEAVRRFAEFPGSKMPFNAWLGFLTRQRLAAVYRHHLGVQARDKRRELRLKSGNWPGVSSTALAAQLSGKLTSPTHAFEREENRALVQKALESMKPIDREVLCLRHYEHLTNLEVAAELGLEENAASRRHVRALMRLKKLLDKEQ